MISLSGDVRAAILRDDFSHARSSGLVDTMVKTPGFWESSSAVQRVAGFSGALAVALGAFGSHALPRRVSDPKLLRIWETGATYHLVHSLALALAARGGAFENRPAKVASLCFATGIALFSGSLYALTLTGKRRLGAVAPLGGTAFILGWVALALRR
jgi:uncharacterized membrane protein YgdD (TMEM256/DUF423 family)